MPRSHGTGPASRSRAGPVPACALPQGPWSLLEVAIGTLGLSILYSQSRGSKEGSHVLPSSLHLPCHGGESPRVPRNPFQKPLGRVQHSPLSKNHSPEPGADHCACSPHTPWLPTQTHASGLSTVQSRPLTILSFSKAHLKSHLPKSNPAFSCLQSKLTPENTREKVDREVFLSQQPCPKCKHRDRCVQLHTPQST